MRRPRSLWIAAALIASTVLAAAAVTFADQTSTRADRMLSRLQKHLGLTDDQMNQMRPVFEQQRDAARQLGQNLHKAQTDLRQLALNAGDPSAIAAKKAEVAQLIAQGLDLRVQTLQQIGPILTAEQRTKLAQMGPAAMWRGHRHHRPAQQG